VSTCFQDGPARNVTLNLGRTPLLLRVTRSRTKKTWDACNELEDEPREDEEIFAYHLAEGPFRAFVRRSGGGGGSVVIAAYRFLDKQPADADMRTNDAWRAWCSANDQRRPCKDCPTSL